MHSHRTRRFREDYHSAGVFVDSVDNVNLAQMRPEHRVQIRQRLIESIRQDEQTRGFVQDEEGGVGVEEVYGLRVKTVVGAVFHTLKNRDLALRLQAGSSLILSLSASKVSTPS